MTDLDIIRQALDASRGDLRRIANATGIGYDTLLRIRAGEGEPKYGNVVKLAEHFRLKGARRAGGHGKEEVTS